ncbi:hypothetical protein AND4_11104 [Vibrio sp. AND4]|nr:hypothetical protein AND4_11104 [Vibrio sp. AND4]
MPLVFIFSEVIDFILLMLIPVLYHGEQLKFQTELQDGEGAFYRPKVENSLTDSMGRKRKLQLLI